MTGVSIIILTYNRPHYLKRILDYYSGYKNNFNFIIADSSSDENKMLNKEIIFLFPDLDILYLSNYQSQIDPWNKSADALNYVKSQYCLFCADDDFITPNGINEAVDFLENNPDFTLAHGHYVSFYLKTEKEKQQIYWTFGSLSESITFLDSENRLFQYLSNCTVATFYGVHRTDFLKMILEETLRVTNDWQFAELLSSTLTLVYGKMKCLDILYSAREVNFESAGQTQTGIGDFIRKGSFDEKYNKFKNCLAVHLSKNSQLTTEEANKIIDAAMSLYLKKSYPNNFGYFVRKRIKDIFDYLNLPEGVFRKIKSFYLKLKIPKLINNFNNSIDDSPFKNHDDLKKIYDCIILHTQNQNL